MSLRVLTPARFQTLCTLQSVKDRLGLTGSGEDATLSSLIARATRAMASDRGRELLRQRYELETTGNDRQRLTLPVYPVDRDSITVEIDGVAETDFILEEPSTGVLYLSRTWSSKNRLPHQPGEPNTLVRWIGGWVSPDLMKTWVTLLDLTNFAGYFVAAPSSNPQPLLFEVTTAGIMAADEPAWPTTGGTTVTSGTAALTARDAVEVPLDVQEAALLAVISWRRGDTSRAGNLTLERLGPQELQYAPAGQDAHPSALPRAAQALLEAYP